MVISGYRIGLSCHNDKSSFCQFSDYQLLEILVCMAGFISWLVLVKKKNLYPNRIAGIQAGYVSAFCLSYIIERAHIQNQILHEY